MKKGGKEEGVKEGGSEEEGRKGGGRENGGREGGRGEGKREEGKEGGTDGSFQSSDSQISGESKGSYHVNTFSSWFRRVLRE